MKKTIATIIIAAVLCTSVFASATLIGNPDQDNNGWWLGPSVCYLHQGVGATYDFGSFDVTADFGIPVLFGIPSLIAEPSFSALAELLLMDDLRIAGYYSLVDANWFTFNIGAMVDICNYINHFVPTANEQQQGKTEGVGGATSFLVTPALQMKFQIKNKVSIKLTASGVIFSSGGAHLGFGTSFAYGHEDAKLGALMGLLVSQIYEFANIGVQFKL